MYNVSSAFRTAMKNPVQEHRVTGTIGSISFTEANIVEGSFQISNQCSTMSDVVLGSVYTGQLTAEFTGINIAYGSWINKVITPTFALKVGDISWESVPLGIFIVKEAKHTANGVQVTAYDRMIKFDKKFKKKNFKFKGKIWQFIQQICTDCNMTCANTEGEIQALPNGNRDGLEIYNATGRKADFANDIHTYRDLLYWVAQSIGCFATVNRAGQLEFRNYTQYVADTITEQYRLEGATFADYITHYVGMYFTDLDTNQDTYYGYDAEAIQAEINATNGELQNLNTAMEELEAAYEAHEISYDDYIAQKTALTTQINQLTKRLAWLNDALAQADDGSNMEMGENPLLCDKKLTKRDNERLALLAALDDISYTPFSASCIYGLIYDLGDVIRFSGGLYNSDTDSFGCVMAYTYTLNGETLLEGYGTDTSVVKIKTIQEKKASAARETADNAINATDYTLDKMPDTTTPTPSPSMQNNPVALVDNKTDENGKRTMHYWAYNANYADPYWSTYKGVVLSDNMPFVVCQYPTYISGQHRKATVAGKLRDDMTIVLVGRIEGYAGSPLSQYPIEQEYAQVSGLASGPEFTFGQRWNNLYNVGCTSKEYWYVQCNTGTTLTGVIDEDTPVDFTFENFAQLIAAVNGGEILIDDSTATPSDYVTKLPTQKSANKVNKKLDNLGNLLNEESVSDDSDAIDFMTGPDVMTDGNITKTADSLDKIYEGASTLTKDISSNSGLFSKQLKLKQVDGTLRPVADIPTLYPRVVEPSELTETTENNSLLFTLGDNSGIEVEAGSGHDWTIDKFDFSFDELGWYANTSGIRGAATHQYATFAIGGLTVGSEASFNVSEMVKPYAQERTFRCWGYNPNYGYEIVDVTISCNVPFVMACVPYSADTYTFTYNGTEYTKTAYWLDIAVISRDEEPVLTYSETVVWTETAGNDFDLEWSETPQRPATYEETPYYVFGNMMGSTVMGMLDDTDMDYTFTSLDLMWEGFGSMTWNKNFVKGVALGVLFSDSATISDFTALPTDRGTWHSTEKFHSFYADDEWHNLTCTFTATAENMYMHLVLDGLADSASNDDPAYVYLKKILESAQAYGIQKFFGKWGDRWYEFLGGGSGVADYPDLTNKPSVNSVTLLGDKTTRDLGMIEECTQAEYDQKSITEKNNPDKVFYIKDGGGGGGGGGGGSYTETELFSGSASTAGNVSLSDDIGNYDEFVIWAGWSASNVNGVIPIRVSIAMFKTFTYVASPQTSTDHIFCYLYGTQYFRVARGSDDTKIYLFDNHSGAIKRVVGIKY